MGKDLGQILVSEKEIIAEHISADLAVYWCYVKSSKVISWSIAWYTDVHV